MNADGHRATVRRARRLCITATAIGLIAGCSGAAHRTSSPVTAGRDSTTVNTRVSKTPNAVGALGQKDEPNLPAPVQESAAATVGDLLYVVGGYDAQRNSTDSVFVFDGSRWHSGPALPIRINHPGAARLGDELVVAGGFTPSGASNRAFVLSANASTWREIAPLRRARGALALLSLDRHLYAVGGRDASTQVGISESYDPQTNRWTDLPPMPDARNHLAGFVSGARLCVAGGRTPETSTRVDCYDPKHTAWNTSTTLPVATSGAAAAIVDGQTVVAGGEPAGETRVVDFVQSSRAGSWSTAPMLVPRHGTGFAVYRGRLWMCGGATSAGFAAVATCTSIGA